MFRSSIIFLLLSLLYSGEFYKGDTLVRKGVYAFYNYDFDTAVEVLEQARIEFPEHPGVHLIWVAARWVRAQANNSVDDTYQILENQPRLSYGVSVSDVNNDGNFEFIVTGFGFNNLALAHKKGILFNSINQSIFIDKNRKTIGVASCDIDQDGYEEIYFLNVQR